MKKNEVLVSHFLDSPNKKNWNREKEKKTIALECKNSAFSFLQYIKYPQN